MNRNLLLNQRGSALIAGMIAAISVGIVSAIIMQQSQLTQSQTRVPVIKSNMMVVESEIRQAAFDGTLFVNCPGTIPNCKQISSSKIASFARTIPGAKCTKSPCGVSITTSAYNPLTGLLTARISYDGTEVSVAPIDISTNINTDSWQTKTQSCPAATPLLISFKADGTPNCKALPADCPAGSYIRDIDPMSITNGLTSVICSPFQKPVSCPAGQYMSNIQWDSAGGITFACLPLMNPFAPAALSDPTKYVYTTSPPFAQAPVPTTMPSSASCAAGQVWKAFSSDTYGQSDDVCKLPLCSSIDGTAGAVTSPGAPTQAWCVNSYGACCSDATVCNGNYQIYTCQGGGFGMCGCNATYSFSPIGFYLDVLGTGSQAECLAAQKTLGGTCQPGTSQTGPLPPDCYVLLADKMVGPVMSGSCEKLPPVSSCAPGVGVAGGPVVIRQAYCVSSSAALNFAPGAFPAAGSTTGVTGGNTWNCMNVAGAFESTTISNSNSEGYFWMRTQLTWNGTPYEVTSSGGTLYSSWFSSGSQAFEGTLKASAMSYSGSQVGVTSGSVPPGISLYLRAQRTSGNQPNTIFMLVQQFGTIPCP